MSEIPTRAQARVERRTSRAAAVRHGRLKQRRVVNVMLRFTAVMVSVVVFSTVVVAGYAWFDLVGNLKPAVALVDKNGKQVVPAVGAIDGSFNILLAGSDSGDGNPAYGERGETLNDVTMLLHVSADHKNATVISFPRDMFVQIPSCPDPKGGHFSAMSKQKINSTLSYGGLACTVLTVENLTGLEIPYAALIEFDGVIEMSNAVGGVPVCVAGAINDPYTGLALSAGDHTLQGAEALAFLRTRHGVGDGSDLGRISNQQVFLSSLVRTVKSAGTLSNPTTVYALAKAATSNMTMSTSLNKITTLASMALALKNVDVSKVVFVQYPNHYVDGGVDPSTAPAAVLMNALKYDHPVTITGDTGVGSEGAPGQAAVTPSPAGTGSPTRSATTTPAQQGSAVDLPQSVHGQTGAQVTCSKPFSE